MGHVGIDFVPWGDGPVKPRLQAIVQQLETLRSDQKVAHALTSLLRGCKKPIRFHVIDVMPCSVPDGDLEVSLHQSFFYQKQTVPEDHGYIDRLFFVGSSPTVDSWEHESNGEGRFSRKKSVEFYIRALQSTGAGHYACLSEPRGHVGDIDGADFRIAEGLARSAMMGLCRYYGSPQKGTHMSLADQLRGMARDIDDLIMLVKGTHPHVDLSEDPGNILIELAKLFQLGKRLSRHVPGAQDQDYRYSGTTQQGSYLLRFNISEHLKMGRDEIISNENIKNELIEYNLSLVRYEILRDMGRCIASGAFPLLRERAEREPRTSILIIDDRLYDGLKNGKPHQPYTDNLRDILKHAGWGDRCFVAPTAAIPGTTADDEWHGAGAGRLTDACRLWPDGACPEGINTFKALEFVLIEVDSTWDYVGASAVQRLHAYLRRVAGADIHPHRTTTPIVVLTRTQSFGDVQQSLNMGAAAYVHKERLYQLPFQMWRAWNAIADTSYTTRRASSFKMLHALRPELRAKLRKRSGTSFVHGGVVTADGVLIDQREMNWIRELPKADLHCHLGTCIPLPAIEVLALNTCRYTFAAPRYRDESRRVTDAATRIARTLVLAEWLCSTNHRARRGKRNPLTCLALSAAAICKKSPEDLPEFGIGDQVIDWLVQSGDGIRPFEAMGLLVALISIKNPAADIAATQPYLDYLGGVASKQHVPFIGIAAELARRRIQRIAGDWSGRDTRQEIGRMCDDAPDGSVQSFWVCFSRCFVQGIGDARCKIEQLRRTAEEWLYGERDDGERNRVLRRLRKLADELHYGDYLPDGVPSMWTIAKVEDRLPLLRDYVQLPRLDGEDGHLEAHGLRRYLWGADLLGAAHLQYPDNLLIAAYAVTRDNARDSVVYSEVRCETPGFAQGGMSAFDATRLLCAGFDLASCYVKQEDPVAGTNRLVRTNILLAAKRHKSREAAREVVDLMLRFRSQHGADRRQLRDGMPSWWRPCDVVGFDISGDEAKQPNWMQDILRPLAVQSVAITIHAGEAASADSIWQAVYMHNATRIGHGLRLRENEALLQYCVSEGICMEMCPNSNIFTNAYLPEDGGRYADEITNSRRAYPLKTYMEAGLEVSVATDNRYIHREPDNDLTSEYMAAARLSNGLTRWEILQIVKAGFKNAFLAKDDIQCLVSEMENRVYAIAARGWF